MDIRNNLLSYLKKKYLKDLSAYYDKREAEQLLTILIEHFFGVSRNQLIMDPDIRLSESEILKIHMSVKELKKFKPVQYITGMVEFHDLVFKVSPDVLIPRPETEELVQIIAEREKGIGLVVLEIGTGSGCIPISLKSLLKNAIVHATDISASAISIAKENAKDNNLEVEFHNHDILHNDNIVDIIGGPISFDVIVSNPPYVTNDDKSKMHSNVIDYEPDNALFVPDNDPLLYYNAILKFTEKSLKKGGRIYFEINESLGSEMLVLVGKYGYSNVELLKDIRGKDRFIVASGK